MKELKDFLEEVEKESFDISIFSHQGLETKFVVLTDEVKRIVSEAYIAGMNFQAAQVKRAPNGRV